MSQYWHNSKNDDVDTFKIDISNAKSITDFDKNTGLNCCTFFAFVIGILMLKESVASGIFMILISIILFISAIIKFRKVYLNK